MKKSRYILLGIIFMCLVVGSSICLVKKKRQEVICYSTEAFKTCLREKEQWIAQLFAGRQYWIEEDTLTIGNQIKELQNGYFDVKFIAQKEELVIYINKLYQTDREPNLIESTYLSNIITFWKEACHIAWKKEEQETLEKHIADCYVALRSSVEYVDYDTLIFPEKWKQWEQPKIQARVEENMLVLSCQF